MIKLVFYAQVTYSCQLGMSLIPDPSNPDDLRDSQTIECQWDTNWDTEDVSWSSTVWFSYSLW